MVQRISSGVRSNFLELPAQKTGYNLAKNSCMMLLGISSFFLQSAFIHTARAAPGGMVFDWEKIIPGSNLTWVGCFVGRECARLEVPLDYSDPAGEKAAVALIRVKANVSTDSTEYRGPVLFNPGGPGQSGIAQVNERGDIYQGILGKEYDIIGFDPRGIGATTPEVSIFSDVAERAAWDAGAPSLLNSTPDALSRSFFRAQLFNELVEARSKQAAEHVSTAVVARDMLSIVKAHGRDRLQFWGFSYGSVLGATYAAMFPENIERLIIDGVLDASDYYSGLLPNSLLDTDKALQFIYSECAKAGSACPLHANSSTLVSQRVDALFASIKENPVPATDGTDYALIDFTILKTGLFVALISPFSTFPPLAQAFAALENRDGTPFLRLFRTIQPQQKCDVPPPLRTTKEEAGFAIQCSEAAQVANSTEDITQHFELLSKSSIFADTRTDTIFTPCSRWKVPAKERFAGPFAVNTSFPMLIVGNTADPLTPLVSAQKATHIFQGSALLTINTPGHTSEAATSPCANQVIRDYFRQGKLPDNGTVCETEDVLFDPMPPTQNATAQNA